MPLHHLPLGKGNPLFRQKREDDEAENNPFDEVFKVGEVSAKVGIKYEARMSFTFSSV